MLVEAWWRHDRSDDIDSPDYWAWDMADRLTSHTGHPYGELVDLVDLVVALSAKARDERELAYVGASAIEAVLRSHPEHLERIEEAARLHRNFRHALRCAWFECFLAPEASVRLRAFGQPF